MSQNLSSAAVVIGALRVKKNSNDLLNAVLISGCWLWRAVFTSLIEQMDLRAWTH